MVRIVVEVDESLHQQIKVAAAQENRPIRLIVIEMLKSWLKSKKRLK